jgi:recombination protein RecT
MMNSVMTCAQLGLEPSKTLGRIHLIPYGKEVQCILGYQGLVELARRSGEISEIYAECVYQNDRFVYEMGLNKKLEHVPDFSGDRGDFKCCYAVAKYKDGGNHIVVMSREDVDRIKSGTKYKNEVWDSHFDEMAKKTAIRRLAKLLPLTIELEKAATITDHEISGSSAQYKDELESIGINVVDVESTDVSEEKDVILAKIRALLEKQTEASIRTRTGKSKDELLNSASIDLEKARVILSIVAA